MRPAGVGKTPDCVFSKPLVESHEAGVQMPIERRLDGPLIRTTVSGLVTYADIEQHVREARRTQTFNLPEIVDAQGVTAVGLSLNDLIRAASLVRDSLGDQTPGRRAILVNNGDHARLARIFASLTVRWLPVAVFATPTEAEMWATAPRLAEQLIRKARVTAGADGGTVALDGETTHRTSGTGARSPADRPQTS
jgi:hypothetical protein